MKQVNLKIKGCKDKTLKTRVAKAVQISKRHLMPRIADVNVEIRFRDELGGFYGLCSAIDDKEYLIEILNNGDTREMLSTIIHEMTHVKQYIRKELSGGVFGVYLWKGNIIKAEIDNAFTPWENEAYETETLLIERV